MAKSVENLTDNQLEALKQFKKNVSDVLDPDDNDVTLIKWLRARNYNAKKAEVYYREMQCFKKVYDIDKLLETYVMPEVLEKYTYTAIMGFAKDGSIVRYNPVGDGDHLGFLMSISTYEVARYAGHLMTSDQVLQKNENKRTGKEINEITYIFDLEGFSIHDILHKTVLEMALDLGHMVQEYYPEVWGKIFFINVPSYFDVAYNIFRPIIQQTVIKRLVVVSKENTPQTLLKYIDADVLPEFLGGKRVDSNGDPRCSEFLKYGGKLPGKYYATNRELLSSTDPGVESVWIAARSVHNVCFVVRKPGSWIRVEFRTENGSIQLKVLLRKFNGNSDSPNLPAVDEYLDEKDEKSNVAMVSPPLRIQSHLVPVSDGFKTPWEGIYILMFNNSHSWFGSRRLIHRIALIEPET